jgi:linoleoyl-CoA desaturase
MVPAPSAAKIRFSRHGAFYREVIECVDAYFERSGRRRRDMPQMYLKSALLLAWFAGSWTLLVFAAASAWQAALCAVSLGLSIAAIGMGVQHDANHGAYSSRPWVNRLFSCSLDLMGVSSYIWRQKHNVIHHTFTNIDGIDSDIDFGPIARLTSEQPWYPWHRFQHLYCWIAYGSLLPKWVFLEDFLIFFTRKIGPHDLPKLDRSDVARFVIAKVVFVAWAIVIPSFFHPFWQVMLFHLLAIYTLGVTLATVFQSAHCVEGVEFPVVPEDGAVDQEWAAHQLETTVDFGRNNPVATWFFGGLSFQIEHHLFPKVCHLNYPALSHIIDEVAAKHHIHVRRRATVREGIAAHYRHIRRLGQRMEGRSPTAPLEGAEVGR